MRQLLRSNPAPLREGYYVPQFWSDNCGYLAYLSTDRTTARSFARLLGAPVIVKLRRKN